MSLRRALFLILLAAAASPYLVGLGSTSIIDANEAFYTETPREMIEARDYINPAFNYEPRFNKPPLSYWVVAGSYHAFGISLWSARIPVALGALALIAAVFLLGRIAFSTDAGLIAALTLAAAPRFLLFSRRIIIDIYTTTFLGLTLLFFVLAETEPARRRQWLVAMYAAVGFGVLTKGPVAALLPALVFVIYLVAAGRLNTIRRMLLPAGVLILAVIVLPYYGALYAQHGWTYIRSFLFEENLARFAEGVGAPSRGPLFYLPVVFADLYFPWSLLLPAALALVPWRALWRRRPWRAIWGSESPAVPATLDQIRLLFGLWIVVIVGFFSASHGQQDLYVLPFVAAAAPLVGGALDGSLSRMGPSRVRPFTRTGLVVVAAILCVVFGLVGWLVGGDGAPMALPGARLAGVVLAIGAAAAMLLAFRRAWLAAFAAVAAVVVVGEWVLVLQLLPAYERFKPMPRLAAAIVHDAASPPKVATYRVAAPSLVFYLQRHVSFLMDEAQVRDYFHANGSAYCIMREADYRESGPRLGVRTRVVAASPVFEGRLRDFLDRTPLPRMLVVTNRLAQVEN